MNVSTHYRPPIQHSTYPHIPGCLYGCELCEAMCFCNELRAGQSEKFQKDIRCVRCAERDKKVARAIAEPHAMVPAHCGDNVLHVAHMWHTPKETKYWCNGEARQRVVPVSAEDRRAGSKNTGRTLEDI